MAAKQRWYGIQQSLSGERFRRGLAAWLGGLFAEFALGARPIRERISGGATALQIKMISAQRDLLRCWSDAGCA